MVTLPEAKTRRPNKFPMGPGPSGVSLGMGKAAQAAAIAAHSGPPAVRYAKVSMLMNDINAVTASPPMHARARERTPRRQRSSAPRPRQSIAVVT